MVFSPGFQGGSLHSIDICSEYRVCAHCPRITLGQIIFVSADNTSAAMNQLSPIAVLFLLILSFSRHCLLLFNVVWCLSLIQGSRCSRSQPQHCNISRWRAGWGEESKKSTFVWDNFNFIECQGNAKYLKNSQSCSVQRPSAMDNHNSMHLALTLNFTTMFIVLMKTTKTQSTTKSPTSWWFSWWTCQTQRRRESLAARPGWTPIPSTTASFSVALGPVEGMLWMMAPLKVSLFQYYHNHNHDHHSIGDVTNPTGRSTSWGHCLWGSDLQCWRRPGNRFHLLWYLIYLVEKNILCVPNLILVHIYLVEEHRLSIKGVNGFADDSWSERPPMLRPSVRWEKDRSLKLWSELSFLICAGQEQESLGVMRSVSVHCETFVNFGASTVHFLFRKVSSGGWVGEPRKMELLTFPAVRSTRFKIRIKMVFHLQVYDFSRMEWVEGPELPLAMQGHCKVT